MDSEQSHRDKMLQPGSVRGQLSSFHGVRFPWGACGGSFTQGDAQALMPGARGKVYNIDHEFRWGINVPDRNTSRKSGFGPTCYHGSIAHVGLFCLVPFRVEVWLLSMRLPFAAAGAKGLATLMRMQKKERDLSVIP